MTDPMRRPDAVAKLAVGPAPSGAAFTAVALLVMAALLGAAVGVTVAVDPRGEWGSPMGYQPLVLADPYQHKLDLYRAYGEEPPELVLLGSSRMATFDPDDWPGASANGSFNYGLSGAGGHDLEVVLRHLLADDEDLQTLVLNLDAFSLLDGRRSTVLQSTAYDDLTGHPPPTQPLAGRLLASATARHVYESAEVLRRTHLTGYPEPHWTFDPDGLRHEPGTDRQRAAGTFDLDAVVADQYTPVQLRDFTGQTRDYDDDLAQRIADLLRGALLRGVEVHLLFPPYAPAALDRLETLPDPWQRIRQMTGSFLPLCGEGLHLHDFTDGDALGLDPTGYYDGHHLTPENARLVLEAMAAGVGDLCSGS